MASLLIQASISLTLSLCVTSFHHFSTAASGIQIESSIFQSIGKKTVLANNPNSVFSSVAWTNVECGLLCADHESCASFALWDFKGTAGALCEGFNSIGTMLLPTDDNGVEVFKYGDAPEMSWLNMTCTDNTQCPVPMSECFNGHCLCTAGYYYSEGSKTCIATCAQADLGSIFLVYPLYLIAGYNDEYFPSPSWQNCTSTCLLRSFCRTAEISSSSTCYLSSKTALDVPSSYVTSTSYKIAQRSCA